MEEEEEKKNNGKRNIVILWAVLILMIIVVLVISSSKPKSSNKVAVDSNETVQTEKKDSEENEEEKEKNEITFSKNSIILVVGNSETLEIVDSNPKDVVWTSSHPTIATVDGSGMVTAVSMGTSIITGKVSDGNYASCTIIVKDSSIINKNTEDTSNNVTDTPINAGQDYYTPTQPNDVETPDWDSNNPEEPEIPINNEPIEETIKHTVEFMIDNSVILTQEIEEGQTIGFMPANPSKYRIYIQRLV